MTRTQSVIKRIYIPNYLRALPNGVPVRIPGYYLAPSC